MAEDNPTGIVSHQQHGIGQLINEFNREYQNTYNTTTKVFKETTAGDDIVVNIENAKIDKVAALYGRAMSVLARENYGSGSYPPAATTLRPDNITGTVGRGDSVENVSMPDNYGALAVDPYNGTFWTVVNSDFLEHLNRDGSYISDASENVLSAAFDLASIAFDFRDGTLWGYDDDSNIIRHYDPYTKTEMGSVTGPAEWSEDLVLDPLDNTFWLVDTTNTIYNVNRSGTVVTSFAGPGTDAEGLAIDYADGNLWVFGYDGTDHGLWKVDKTGSVLVSQKQLPGYNKTSTQEMSTDPVDGSIWIIDTNDSNLYRINPYASGRLTNFSGETWLVKDL